MHGAVVYCLAVLAAAGAARAGEPTRIVVDGRLDDWSNVPLAFSDPTDDQGCALTDIQDVYITNDDTYLYLRLQIGVLTNLQSIAGPIRLYFDVDQDPTTGWPVGAIGSDFVFMFPELRGAEQSDTTYELNTISHATLEHYSSPSYAAVEFELRFRRDVSLPERGIGVFESDAFDLIIEAQSIGGEPCEFAPDQPAGHTYTLATGPIEPLEVIDLRKCNAGHVRIVTWNMSNNGLFERTPYFERILQALQPDILAFQEIHEGEARTIVLLTTILPIPEGGVWNVYRTADDAICSPFPLRKKLGDTIPSTNRGQAMALVDLPDDDAESDIYIISAHMKCCGSHGSPEDMQRQRHSDANVNWLRDLRTPGEIEDLDPDTPIVVAGDFNMVGGPQPLRTLITGDIQDEATFGSDSPPDWDGTDLADLVPRHNAAAAAFTWRDPTNRFTPGRLDFVLFTDAVASASKAFVFNTADLSPADLERYGVLPGDSQSASDHLPVVVDLLVHPPGGGLFGDGDGDGDVDAADYQAFQRCFSGPAGTEGYRNPGPDCLRQFDSDVDADVDLLDWRVLQRFFGLTICDIP